MPIFTSSSHVQINGGNFVHVGGDFNVQSFHSPAGVDEVLAGLDFRMDDPDHQLKGVERQERGIATRMHPYDTSHRRRILPYSKNAFERGEWSTSSANALSTSVSKYPSGQVPRLECDPPWGTSLQYRHPRATNPRPIHPGPHFKSMSSGLGSGVRSLPVSSLPFQNQGSSQPQFALPWNSEFPALEYPPGSHASEENLHSLDVYPADLGVGPTKYPGYLMEPSFGSRPTVNGSKAFPWNHPSNAPSTSINGGTFIGGNVKNIQRHGEPGLHILSRVIASDAFHDSAERFPQPRCHPETRTKLLDALMNWASGINPPRNWTAEDFFDEIGHGPPEPSSGILWLHGPAGSGKSAVAQSLCQQLKDERRLGGSFFKRGHPSRGNAKRLFPTIAYQLSLLHPKLRQLISDEIENDPAIVDRSLSDQLQTLVIGPCRRICLPHLVIVIDGLDECDGDDTQQEVLRSIAHASCRETLPILIFIASRPESHIRETFAELGLNGISRALNINKSFNDVRRYLLHEFGRIHSEHRTMAGIPLPWPQSNIVEDLVQKSSGYFIYAATVVKFIGDKRFHPVDRLDTILGIKDIISGSPFHTLDQLYLQILSAVALDFRPEVILILAVICAYIALNVSDIEHLLGLRSGDLRLILRDLHSVVNVPDEGKDGAVYVHHASFLDFLKDPARSGPFYTGSLQCRKKLTYDILKALSAGRDDPLGIHCSEWVCVGADKAIPYMTLTEPFPEFLPLVQSMNPDFVLAYYGSEWGRTRITNVTRDLKG
ncbi:hypothetical protein MVEN_00886200 [Mycena venus]|uniref:NACHT domain-containing protein n=1 Tax=Mycena venus TaxID=2733690 RepID=A0A8H7D3T4_9AGAR|nr:hypothetical protein MVEN_00886200 [Mycena venus]